MRLRRLVAACAAAVFLVLGAGSLPAAAEPPAVPDDVGKLVGAAVDPDTGTLWLAGDRADDGVLVGVDDDGQHTELSFADDLTSVQALAFHDGYLYVGDIGDENASRDFIVVYRLAETTGGRQSYQAYDLSFSDGPQHATAMMVSGRGRIYVITGGEDPGIYNSSLELSRTNVNSLTRVADAPEGVTDGVFLADGSTIVLRTAEGLRVINAFGFDTLATETLVGAADDEVVAVTQDGALVVGSAAGLRESAVPTSDVTTTVEPVAPDPEASSAEPSGSATDAAPDGADPAEDEGSAPARTGTTVAVVLALVVAGGAGVSTLLLKD